MTLDLTHAEVFDIETLPNCFTFAMELFNGDEKAVWEISDYRDDRASLLEHFRYLAANQIPLIGYNNIGYDYPIIHMLWKNPNVTNAQLYQKSQQIITSFNSYGNRVWASDRFCPQIDIYLINHFDNRAKSTGLKTLQINMRSPNVVESSLPFDRPLTKPEIDNELIPYNMHDVQETKRFAHHCKTFIDFRIGLIDQFGIDVLNWNDTKIGEQMVIQRLGDEVCYDRSSGKRQIRQTVRNEIRLNEIIFPYIKFEHPEFNRVLDYLRQQTLRTEDFKGDEDGVPSLQTKGVFSGLSATVNGFQFDYGVGGIHGSVHRQRVVATEEYPVRDIDVAALYPNIAIQNGLHPEHLGQRFVEIYSQLPKERKRWQEQKGKKSPEANALKLASNGTYGKSNSVYSPLYDAKFTMTITINGQLMLSMLAEKLMAVPTVRMLQINTDGMTYQIHHSQLETAKAIERQWESLTRLVLEDAAYDRMFIRDVNAYLAIGKDDSVKAKGVYWSPDPLNYRESITNSQPPAWHKRFDATVSTRAAVAHMVDGIDMETYIRLCTNPYDFCCAVKVNRSDKLLWGGVEQQRNTRFYVTTHGDGLIKISPPAGPAGAFKKANGVSDADYARVMNQTNGAWDERVCTKNRSIYEQRVTGIMAGYSVQVVNNIEKFDWSKINYNWYLQKAKELVI